MKKFLLSLVSLLVLAIGNLWADEAYYTLDTTGSTKTDNNGYATTGTATVDGIEWVFEGNGTINPWRLGGKNLTEQDRVVYTKTSMDVAISSVKLTVGNASSITVNSLKLIVASDAGFEDVIDEVSKDFEANSDITFEPTAPATSWAADAYYKFVFNVSVSGNSNKFVEFKTVEFFKDAGSEAPAVAKPVITPSTGTYFGTQTVVITAEEGADIFYTLNGGGETAYTAPFEVNETTVVVAYAKKGEAKSGDATSTITLGPSYTTFAAANAAAVSDKVQSQLSFSNALVVYVNGQNAYLRDETGGFLVYGTNTLKAGDRLSGTITGQLFSYNGLPELQNPVFDIEVISSDNEIASVEVDAADLAANPLNYVNQYIVVKPATFAADAEVSTKTNVNFTVGETALILRNNFTITFSVEAAKTYSVAGFVAIYNTNIQVYPVAAADIAEYVPVYIQNADFSSAEGWTAVVSSEFRDLGMYQIGGEQMVRFAAPTADETHLNTEYAAGFECRWNTNFASYTQTTAEIPAGDYVLVYDVENVNGGTTKAAYENRFTVTVGETVYTDDFTEWMNGKSAWTTHGIPFTLAEAQSVTISLGYGTGSNNIGANNTPAIYVSHLELVTAEEYETIKLDAARKKKAAELEALPRGNDLFQYSNEALLDAIAALAAAKTVEEIAAVKAVQNLPDAEKAYVISNNTAAGNLSINESNVTVEANAKVYFTFVEGGFVLSNDEGKYIFKTTADTWTLSTTENSGEAYVLNANLVEGGYTLQGANGFMGLDNTTAGSAVYANKSAENNGIWTIAEYVAPTLYTVSIAEGIQNGTVAAEPTSAEAGAKIQLTATPAEGYELESYSVTCKTIDELVLVAEDGTFTMPADDVTVSATFVEAAPVSGIILEASEGAYAESANNYVKEWTSNTNPIVTVTTGANNMDKRVTETFQWHSGSAGSSTYTIAVPINYIITSCTITAKGRTAEQTITAGEAVKTFGTEDYDELVISNLSNPSTSFTLTGANASGLLIQKIELGIAPNPNFNISNDKAYTLTTPRGSLGVSEGQLVSTAKDFTASNFAIISYNSAFYLWSVEAGRFIQNTGDASNYEPTPINLVALDGGKYQIRYGNNAINVSAGYAPGLVINSWTTVDEGNAYTIEAAADFDATEALAILATPITFTNKVTDLANLSDAKAYAITNARGTWNVDNGATAMNTKKLLPDAACEQFALLQQQGQYFIYSVNAKKFLNPDNTLGDPAPVNITPTGNEDYPWFFSFDASHNINVNGAGTVLIDDWSAIDAGNSNAIIEATDFDSKDALAALAEYFRLFADGKYYLNNVGTGKYLAAGSNWGTHAVVDEFGLDYDIKMAEGKYTLDSQVSNGGVKNFLNGEWNDGVAFGWTFNEVSEGVYTISDGTKFLTAGENGVVTLEADGTVDAAKWTLTPAATRAAAQLAALEAATAENGVDATFLIKGANFNRNDLRNAAWTATKSGGNQTIAGPSADRTTFGCESWNNTFEVSQTLANIPEGVYEFSIAGYGSNGTTYIFANETEAAFVNTTVAANFGAALDAIAAGEYKGNTTGKVNVIGETLKIGVKRTSQVGQDWAVFDNARLTYYGSVPADAYKPAYESALAAAKAALDNEDYAAVTGEEKTALASAIETYSSVEETVEAYKAAISALSAATLSFTGAKGDYDALVAAKAANAERSYKYADADKKAAAEASLTAEATSAADAKEKTAAIWTAFRKYADSHALAEGVEGAINMTDHIVNPNAAEAIAEPWAVVKGEGSGGALQILDGEPLTDGDGNTYKYFDGGDWGANAWDVALKQTITLPAGKYMITASGRASGDVQLSLLVGEEKTAIPAIGASGGLFGNGWDDASMEFELNKESDVVIGVQGVTSVVHNWMSFTRFRLVCLEKIEVPAVVLNAPTLNAEAGTQAEPKMYPGDFKLKINFSADNLEANGYKAEDLKVKVALMVSGDLPENIMSMQSETAHRVLPTQPFYIDLGETDFPVELKQGYVYQNIAVVSATLVKPATEETEEEEIATYAGAPVQLHWIGIAPAVKFTVAANIESGTAEETGTSKGFTTVEAGTEFKLLISAENLEANGLNPEELTIEIGMVMESMFDAPSWPMGVEHSQRIMKQNVVVPFAEEIVLEDVVFDKNFPFIQAINFAGFTLKKGDTPIAAIDEALMIRFIEVYENGAPVGIKGIGVDGEKASIYDLSGRKVEKMQRGGIYIVNGKKVSFK